MVANSRLLVEWFVSLKARIMERMIDSADSTVCGIRLSDRSMDSVGYPDVWHMSRLPTFAHGSGFSRKSSGKALQHKQHRAGRNIIELGKNNAEQEWGSKMCYWPQK